eukprot:scaffold127531_cov33-Phaeocystis_antarctica.AAC.1
MTHQFGQNATSRLDKRQGVPGAAPILGSAGLGQLAGRAGRGWPAERALFSTRGRASCAAAARRRACGRASPPSAPV